MNFRYYFLTLLLSSLPLSTLAEVYEMPADGNDVIGALATVTAREADTLLDIARRHGLGYEDIVRANPDVDTWLPGEGTEVVLPTRYVLPPGPRTGIVLNLAEYRMYYFPTPKADEAAIVMTYPMSIGRMDWETPLGRTKVISKVRNPSWYPPESIRAEHAADGRPLERIVPAGPDNPLGEYAMRLGLPGYLIHGTNRPAGVGMRVTHGCVRMFPEDIDFLFGQVAVNTPVRIINEPVKMGWDNDELVVEVHRTLEFVPPAAEEIIESTDQAVAESTDQAVAESTDQAVAESTDQAATDVAGNEEDIIVAPPPVRDAMTALTEQFVLATNSRPGQLDWDVAEQMLERADGIPAIAGRKINDAATSAASE